ncbi:hypothetical protein MAR_008716 [Mya arenaria]|uniref:Uncharacterized protein n=1 Tax=Mya arenaria TaxID=6604 RepID=A0ABY7DWQ9_MYAAR|nr:hypothetical protein MAR_008716 [Mya arenaria]
MPLPKKPDGYMGRTKDIVRLQKFCDEDLKVPSIVRFFGKGGMTAEWLDLKLLHALRAFQPHLVVLILSGNDVLAISSPRRIAGDVLRLRNAILDDGYSIVTCYGQKSTFVFLSFAKISEFTSIMKPPYHGVFADFRVTSVFSSSYRNIIINK